MTQFSFLQTLLVSNCNNTVELFIILIKAMNNKFFHFIGLCLSFQKFWTEREAWFLQCGEVWLTNVIHFIPFWYSNNNFLFKQVWTTLKNNTSIPYFPEYNLHAPNSVHYEWWCQSLISQTPRPWESIKRTLHSKHNFLQNCKQFTAITSLVPRSYCFSFLDHL